MPERPHLTVAQSAERLGVSTKTLRRRIADGHLPAYRVNGGRSLRLKVDDVDALLRRVPTAGTAA